MSAPVRPHARRQTRQTHVGLQTAGRSRYRTHCVVVLFLTHAVEDPYQSFVQAVPHVWDLQIGAMSHLRAGCCPCLLHSPLDALRHQLPHVIPRGTLHVVVLQTRARSLTGASRRHRLRGSRVRAAARPQHSATCVSAGIKENADVQTEQGHVPPLTHVRLPRSRVVRARPDSRCRGHVHTCAAEDPHTTREQVIPSAHTRQLEGRGVDIKSSHRKGAVAVRTREDIRLSPLFCPRISQDAVEGLLAVVIIAGIMM